MGLACAHFALIAPAASRGWRSSGLVWRVPGFGPMHKRPGTHRVPCRTHAPAPNLGSCRRCDACLGWSRASFVQPPAITARPVRCTAAASRRSCCLMRRGSREAMPAAALPSTENRTQMPLPEAGRDACDPQARDSPRARLVDPLPSTTDPRDSCRPSAPDSTASARGRAAPVGTVSGAGHLWSSTQAGRCSVRVSVVLRPWPARGGARERRVRTDRGVHVSGHLLTDTNCSATAPVRTGRSTGSAAPHRNRHTGSLAMKRRLALGSIRA